MRGGAGAETVSWTCPRNSLRSGGDRAQVVERAAEQILAQVEEPCPERAAIEPGPPAHRRREPLERPHEHGELEVRNRDTVRGHVHARAVEHRLPVDELGRARLAEPG